MLFNSGRFLLVFLPITLIVFFILGKMERRRLAIAWLVAASMLFYGWFSVRYLALLAAVHRRKSAILFRHVPSSLPPGFRRVGTLGLQRMCHVADRKSQQ